MKKGLYCKVCKGIFLLFFTMLFNNKIFSQHVIFGSEKTNIELGLNFGPTFFLGDLGGNRGVGTTFIKDVNLPVTKFMKGLFVTAYPNEWLGFRFAAQLTYVESSDKLIKTKGIDETYRKDRNLDFRSNISEAYTAIEFFPLSLINLDKNDFPSAFRPYVFAGVGIFHFNPMGSLTDANGNVTWHYLQPLHTEGEGFREYSNRPNYKLTQLNIPMGAGIKYMLTDNVNLGVELLYRKTFTDYIDDVSSTYINRDLFNKYLSAADANIAIQINDKSFGNGITRTTPGEQRGNMKNNDAYFSFALKIGFKIAGDDNYYKEAAKQTKCPARF